MSKSPETVKLYRVENPNIERPSDGATSHPDLIGQWFTPSLDAANNYLRKSTQTFGKEARVVDGARLVVANVPKSDLESLHASKNPIAANMDIEGDNYIVPRDAEIEIQEIPLDETIGELRGKLGNYNNLTEAEARVAALVSSIGETAIKS
jgi:hypothetical protein